MSIVNVLKIATKEKIFHCVPSNMLLAVPRVPDHPQPSCSPASPASAVRAGVKILVIKPPSVIVTYYLLVNHSSLE